MNTIKAIETTYKGYRFRSRLEARWAVFFDRMGWSWQYEPEGFHLPYGEMYLPDFLLWGHTWAEIKPANAPAQAFAKARALVKSGGGRALLLSGEPDWKAPELVELEDDGSLGCTAVAFNTKKYAPMFYAWGEFDTGEWPSWLDAGYDPALNLAINAARAARFEHGESGARS